MISILFMMSNQKNVLKEHQWGVVKV